MLINGSFGETLNGHYQDGGVECVGVCTGCVRDVKGNVDEGVECAKKGVRSVRGCGVCKRG